MTRPLEYGTADQPQAAEGAYAEPLLHSHVTARLPRKHRLARTRVCCDRCRSIVHLPSNSCMRTWVETGHGNFCLRCFTLAAGGGTPEHRSQLAGVDCLPPSFGIQ